MDYLALLITDAGIMILELVASRLMSPYFGNSNFVWTAIIGIILLAGSLGNLLGGKIASASKNARLSAGVLLLCAIIYVALIPVISVPVLESIQDGDMGTQFSSVLGSIILFLVPSTLLGIMPPILMKERIGSSKDKGKESGRITAVIAIGSLIGTFLGGFFLIPALGTQMIFVLVAVILLIATLCFRPLKDVELKAQKSAFVVMTAIAVAIIIYSFSVVCLDKNSLDNGGSISIDTEYGRIIIENGEYDGDKVRYYKQSGAYSSATYLDEDKKYDLVYPYLKKYDLMFDFIEAKDVAMIGGAAYQYPKYYISHFPDKTMDVIEIDPESTKIAKEYFYLEDLISDYNLEETNRLGLYNEDGRVFLDNTDKKYDAVLNDAFSGEVPVGTLATTEAAQIIKDSLNDGGVYISNVLGAIKGEKGKFMRAEIKTLQKVFKHVYVVNARENVKDDSYSNRMVIATDNDDFRPENVVKVEIKDSDIVLTDDYCPIDSLISTNYHD